MATARLTHVGTLRPDPGWRMARHHHADYELIVVTAGCLHVRIGGQRHTATTGHVLLYPPRTDHTEWTDSSDPVASYYLTFRARRPPAKALVFRDHEGRIRLLAEWLYNPRDLHMQRHTAERDLLLGVILAELGRGPRDREHALAVRVRDFMLRRLAEPITLDMLAREAGLSRFHFVRVYKRLTGQTPVEDLQRLRAEQARTRLLTTDWPLKAIAAHVGLGDEQTLSHAFRHRFGHPPGAYRRGRD